MKLPALFTAFLLSLFLPFSIQAQSAETKQKITQVEKNLSEPIQVEGEAGWTIADRMAFHKVNGLSIAVVQNYKLAWAKGYGWADESLKIPVTAGTLFQAASISKSINSIGLLKLVQDNKIDLYADINHYLTTWKFPYDSLSQGIKISVANLLSHTAGLTVHGFEGYKNGQQLPSIVQILDGQKPANSPAVRSMYAPGLKSEYSGGGITISQLILMDVTHQPYDKYMYNHVLKPLGMKSSTYEQPGASINPRLLATAYFADGKQVPGKYHIYPEQAAAGLWTNPTDLSKYVIETQLAYQGRSHKVLDQQTTKTRLTPYLDKSAALGVFINDFEGEKYFEHNGANEGFRCQYYGSLDGGNGVIVMVNSNNGDIISEIVTSVARVYGFKGLYHSKKKLVKVADTVLQNYVGNYELGPKNILSVTREGNHLYGQPTGARKLELFPESQNRFFLKVQPVEVEFVRDDKGEFSKAVIYEKASRDAKRIK